VAVSALRMPAAKEGSDRSAKGQSAVKAAKAAPKAEAKGEPDENPGKDEKPAGGDAATFKDEAEKAARWREGRGCV
jgi:hypothetical protein